MIGCVWKGVRGRASVWGGVVFGIISATNCASLRASQLEFIANVFAAADLELYYLLGGGGLLTN